VSRAPIQFPVSLLLIDVINAFDFEKSEALVRAAERATPRIDRLAERARQKNVPVIYVNDNFGQWRSDQKATLEECTHPWQPGHRIAARLRPHDGDYYVVKPQHSGFYCTTLELLLNHLGVKTMILTGFAANLCVLFTANDAHMRGYQLVVPADCTASNTRALTTMTLAHVRSSLGGDTRPSTRIDFRKLSSRSKRVRRAPF
jgi:nicotinamidase-related amidase